MAGPLSDAISLPKVQVGSRVINEAFLCIADSVLLIDDNRGGPTQIYYGDIASVFPDSPGLILKKHVVRVQVKRRGWDVVLHCISRQQAVDLSSNIRDAIEEYERRRH